MQTYGIDWLTVAFPIDAPSLTHDQTGEGANDTVRVMSGAVTVASPQGEAKVWLHIYPSGGEWRCSVAANPSRISDPAGYGLVDPHTFLDETLLLFSQIVDQRGILPMTSTEDWQVRRIDLARDFRMDSAPAAVLDALRWPRRAYARTGRLYFDPRTGLAQSLYFGNRSRHVKVYERQVAHPSKGIPDGSLRWEAQLRQSFLRTRGILTVADLTAHNLDAQVESLWNWSNCGVTYTTAADIPRTLDRLYQAGELSALRVRNLLADLSAQAYRFTWPLSTKTRAAYDRLKADLGLTAVTDLRAALHGGAETAQGRLDWLSGTEVTVADPAGFEAEAA